MEGGGLRSEDLERLADRDRTLELLFGELFVSLPLTEFLRRVLSQAAAALDEALRTLHPDTIVDVEKQLILGPTTALTPDITVRRSDAVLPDLVVEVRTESTDRYALGPKRLAYARAGIPEYWFIDPCAEVVKVMRLEHGLPDYRWPPVVLESADTVIPLAFADASVAVGDLVAGSKRRSAARTARRA